MKKIIISAAILFAFTGTQAQLSGDGLLNKTKEKAKQKAEEKARQEQEKIFTSNNHKEPKTKQNDSPSKKETMSEEQTTTVAAIDYSKLNKADYIDALINKANRSRVLHNLSGNGQQAVDLYYKYAAEVDLGNFYAAMKKNGRPTGDDGGGEYDDLMELRNEYPSLYQNIFKPFIEKAIDEAYKLKKSNISDAMAWLEMAKHLNDACVLVISNLEGATEVNDNLKVATKAIVATGAEQSKTFTSDFHKKNVGKILFSKEPIVAGKENPAQFTTSFGPNDYIYGIAYLEAPISQIAKTIDGDKIYGGAFRMNLDGSVQPLIPLEFRHVSTDWDKSYFLIEVRPEPAKAMHREDAVYFATRFADFSPRKHTVAIQLGSYQSSEDFAIGEFKLDWTNGNPDKMMADAKVAATRAEENHAKTVQLDPAFNKPNYAFKDPALSAANLKKAFMAAMPQAVQILKMITIKENASEDWTINRNDYGVIINKSTNHFTSFVYKAKDGNCYSHYVAQFVKVSTGGNSYGNLVMNATGLKDERIACENVK